jgi:hypothetical protein
VLAGVEGWPNAGFPKAGWPKAGLPNAGALFAGVEDPKVDWPKAGALVAGVAGLGLPQTDFCCPNPEAPPKLAPTALGVPKAG